MPAARVNDIELNYNYHDIELNYKLEAVNGLAGDHQTWMPIIRLCWRGTPASSASADRRAAGPARRAR